MEEFSEGAEQFLGSIGFLQEVPKTEIGAVDVELAAAAACGDDALAGPHLAEGADHGNVVRTSADGAAEA